MEDEENTPHDAHELLCEGLRVEARANVGGGSTYMFQLV
jgi:hypothetical protein